MIAFVLTGFEISAEPDPIPLRPVVLIDRVGCSTERSRFAAVDEIEALRPIRPAQLREG